MVNDAGELERLREEVAELRDLSRDLSAALARAVATLPLSAALALAKGGDAGADAPYPLEPWNETIEMTRSDVAPEMALLWRRLPAREGA
jgi:hypothetical protein